MEKITLENLKEMSQQSQYPTISLYMPTIRAGSDVQQNQIRFKNLLREVNSRLREGGMRPPEIDALLEPAQTLLEEDTFWQYQADGLAVFITADDFRHYKLPYTVAEELVINSACYLKPLLPFFTNDGHYYILALSQNAIRMFEATRYSIEETELPATTPLSMDEALALDDPEKQLQFHTGTIQGGQRGGMFHGHDPQDDDKTNIERYLNEVDMGVKQLLRDEQAPLVLAGVDYIQAIYRQASEYPGLVPDGIAGNAEITQPEDLRAQAWEIVEPLFRRTMDEALERYQNLGARGIAADQLNEIAAAAFYARVDTLFVAADTEPVWGKFNAETGEVLRSAADSERSADEVDLLDFAATQTLLNGGVIYALPQADMPTDTGLAAIYRY